MRARRDHTYHPYLLGSADIVLALLHAGYTDACERCERPVHLRQASGLCVWCYNGVAEERRPPLLPATALLRAMEDARRSPTFEPAPAH